MSVFEIVRRLPEITRLREISQAIAMLDAILNRDTFTFDAEWAPGEMMASMSHGFGREYSIVFSAAGACARGFDHESPLSPHRLSPTRTWPGLLDGVPEAFRPTVEEPAFSEASGILLATVVFWRATGDPVWTCGNVELPTPDENSDGADADGADRLFAVLADGRPEAYQEFLQDADDLEVDMAAIEHVYELQPLTRSVVSALNPELDLGDLEPDRKQIGYPAPEEEFPEQPRRSLWGWPLL